MKISLIGLCSICAALFAVSCTPTTPATRISERPMAFEKLSDKHKEMVQRGEIAKGMNMSAVTLAWGDPSVRVEGVKGSRRTERWEYNGSRSVVTQTFFAGYGRSHCGPYHYSGLGAGFGPEVVRLPYRKSAVWFINGKVDEWERRK